MADRAALDAAAKGVHGVFSVQPAGGAPQGARPADTLSQAPISDELLIERGVNLADVRRGSSFGSWQADIPVLRRLHPDLMDFATWLRREGAARFEALFAQAAGQGPGVTEKG
jgi:hypothetical protein